MLLVLIDDAGLGPPARLAGRASTPTADALPPTAGCATTASTPRRSARRRGRRCSPAATTIRWAWVASPRLRPRRRQHSLRPKHGAVAETLQLNGYSTAWFGKNHKVPDWQSSPTGPFDHWPTGMGFDYFYGFVGGEADQWHRMLYEDTTPVSRPRRPEDYNLTEDLADQAIAWIDNVTSAAPDKPFFAYFCPGATHAPAPGARPSGATVQGQFDAGWDAYREETFARQKELGVIPQDGRAHAAPGRDPGLGRSRPSSSG